MPKKIDLTGKIFTYWTVLREATPKEKGNRPGAYWLCKCQCGTEKIVNGQLLRNGQSKSCGCQTVNMIKKKNKLKAENLTGQRFGRLTVLERDFKMEEQHPNRGSTYWKCKCDCGNIVSILKNSLKNGSTKSCGCLHKEIASKNMSKIASKNFNNLVGQRFGKLVVIKKMESGPYPGAFWLCQCDCGNQKIIAGSSLRSKTTISCGCLKQSRGELLIEQLLNQNNILYQKEYPIVINNRKLRFDFVIFNLNKLYYIIEFDGEQHYKSIDYFGGDKHLKETQERDIIKNKWCKKNNIPLIRIPYTHYKDLCLNDLLLETSNFII